MTAPVPQGVLLPLKVGGVIVGTASFDDQNRLSAVITMEDTQLYLRELFKVNAAESLSITIDYVEPHQHRVKEQRHLRLVREY